MNLHNNKVKIFCMFQMDKKKKHTLNRFLQSFGFYCNSVIMILYTIPCTELFVKQNMTIWITKTWPLVHYMHKGHSTTSWTLKDRDAKLQQLCGVVNSAWLQITGSRVWIRYGQHVCISGQDPSSMGSCYGKYYNLSADTCRWCTLASNHSSWSNMTGQMFFFLSYGSKQSK